MNTEVIGWIIIIIAVLVLLIAAMVNVRNVAYKEGQIDALSEKRKYFLFEFKDGTRDWYTVDEAKDLSSDFKDHKIIK